MALYQADLHTIKINLMKCSTRYIIFQKIWIFPRQELNLNHSVSESYLTSCLSRTKHSSLYQSVSWRGLIQLNFFINAWCYHTNLLMITFWKEKKLTLSLNSYVFFITRYFSCSWKNSKSNLVNKFVNY